jgi:hypothetical protein
MKKFFLPWSKVEIVLKISCKSLCLLYVWNCAANMWDTVEFNPRWQFYFV